jgi:aspartyl-tRNA synthetase
MVLASLGVVKTMGFLAVRLPPSSPVSGAVRYTRFMLKTRSCGELRASDAGSQVTLAGWVHRRRDHGGLVFIDLRDHSGLVQVVFNPQESADAYAAGETVRGEYVVQVSGTVAARKPGTENPNLPTGEIEVRATEARVLNPSKTPPFYITEDTEVEELLRLRYRYLDLRREGMHNNIAVRARMNQYIRDFMNERGFIEIETPILTAPTPEGARDFVVPSRIHPGRFYALPQSPQQLKQILMVAGFERYYQIARCFRDEDLRADRQPEFTQLDIEISFAEEEDLLELMEALYTGMFETIMPELKLVKPFPRLSYDEAMERFGSDKPDLRFGMELADFNEALRDTGFSVFRQVIGSGGVVRGLNVPGGAAFSRKQVDDLTAFVQQYGARGLVSMQFTGDGSMDSLVEEDIRSPVAKYFTPEQARAMAQAAGAERGDMLLMVAGRKAAANRVLDALRRELGRRLEMIDERARHFAFVVDFPLFEWNDEDERWYSVTHPFTAPRPEEAHLLDKDTGAVHSRSYDLICNGWELGGGSIRIHERGMQEKVFGILGLSMEEAREKFGHMLEAFEYGAPPHGGTAMGLDRAAALLVGVDDIREVMAFPKTKSGVEPMTGAPSRVSPEQLAELHIAVTEVEEETSK